MKATEDPLDTLTITNFLILIKKYITNTCTCIYIVQYFMRGRRDHDRMVVGFTTTCAISAYHH